MSKLWYLHRGMSCCGYLSPMADSIIDVIGESTLEAQAPFQLFVCRECNSPIPSTELLLISARGHKYLKQMYKPFNDGVEDEVLRETSERSESLQQMSSGVGHERPRATPMQDTARERTNALWLGDELERRSVGASTQVLHGANWQNLGQPSHNIGPKSNLVLLATEQ